MLLSHARHLICARRLFKKIIRGHVLLHQSGKIHSAPKNTTQAPNGWFLSEKFENTSSTSICLKFSRENLKNPSIKYQEKLESFIISLLDEENVAYDIGSYRSAPPGLRIWGGPTVETKDIKLLLPWLNWAYQKAVKIL